MKPILIALFAVLLVSPSMIAAAEEALPATDAGIQLPECDEPTSPVDDLAWLDLQPGSEPIALSTCDYNQCMDDCAAIYWACHDSCGGSTTCEFQCRQDSNACTIYCEDNCV